MEGKSIAIFVDRVVENSATSSRGKGKGLLEEDLDVGLGLVAGESPLGKSPWYEPIGQGKDFLPNLLIW